MYAMQYEITLPADYDMEIIRRRVATRGHLMDDFPGLGLKAYLVRERGDEGGSPVNQYAPFYLWRTAEGMNAFLWGSGFRGIVEDFGRPVVRHWVGAGFRSGPAADSTPLTATRRAEPLPVGVDPAEAIERALAELPEDETLHSAAVAVDPDRWELLRTALWRGRAPEQHGTRYRVLHLSRPGLHELPAGRHW
ncbi:DUF4865 family protein [Kitasatospora sp. NPDC057015]|uniref:DUF4865 family protein n=1 Tax=Kitasatospora sp. NPDC057015 TaxID=3346001 RepID=UPI00363F9CE1